MREVADQAFHIFVMVVILGFGLFGFLATSGVFDNWRQRAGRPRKMHTVRRRGFSLGSFPAAFPQVPFRYRLPLSK